MLSASGGGAGADDDDDATLLVPPAHALACAAGDTVKVRVLDVDWNKKLFDATMLPPLVKAGRTKRRRAALAAAGAPGTVAGARVRAVVQMRKPEYAVCTLQTDDDAPDAATGMLALLQVADFHCPTRAADELVAGAVVDATVVRAASAMAPAHADDGAAPHDHVPLIVLHAAADARARPSGSAARTSRRRPRRPRPPPRRSR